MPKTPLLLGTIKANGDQFEVHAWCPFCGKNHVHGLEAGMHRAAVHRQAHCDNPTSPFRSGGYYVRVPGEEWKKAGITPGDLPSSAPTR